MKPLIHFPEDTYQNLYQTSRLRKNIKAALESKNIKYVDEFTPDIDVAFFGTLEVRDISMINKCLSQDKLVIYFALYQESDTVGKLIFEDKEGNTFIKPRHLKVLNEVSLIVVPSLTCKKLLEKHGVTNKIAVIKTPINYKRFNKDNDLEKQIFLRYFHINDENDIIIGTGNLENEENIQMFKLLANRFPDKRFYYFVDSKNNLATKIRINKIADNRPKNLVVRPLVSDDVFRSGLMNARFYVEPSHSLVGTLSLVDVLASQATLVIHESAYCSDVLPNEVASSYVTLEELISLLEREKEETEKQRKNALNFAKTHSIEQFADEIIANVNLLKGGK
ncbi:MAG: hypothetical protein ACOX28_03000 [Bacilli bacterium]|jgi:1,2-diacylglycerol-3-alpha-glucose alpha-1,2-glucosyltransferase